MRAALNAHFLHHPHTGHGQYLAHLLRAFRRVAPDLEALPACDGVPAPPGGWPGGWSPLFGKTPFDPLGGDLRKVWWEQVGWPRLTAGVGAGVGHVPYFAPPLRGPEGVPVVVTIHDVIPLIIPEYVTSPLVRLYNGLVSRGARRADLVLVDPGGQPAGRAAPAGGFPRSGCGWSTWPPTRRCSIRCPRRRWRGEGPLRPGRLSIFYLGGLDKRKNVPALLKALATLPPDLPWQLFVSGRLRHDNRRLFPDLPRLAEELGIGGRVRFGFVPDEEKGRCIGPRGCSSFRLCTRGSGWIRWRRSLAGRRWCAPIAPRFRR